MSFVQPNRRFHKTWVFLFTVCFIFTRNNSRCWGQDDVLITAETEIIDTLEAIDVPTDASDVDTEEIHVEDYLESLSLSELDEICQHRGFAVEGSTREDYINAARRCLSLENEMNAILAANPELAAELEKEIERMKAEKERLEAERQHLLDQISDLQQQLAESGINDTSLEALLNHKKDPANMTFDEVFKESVSQLYDRVAQDVRFVGKVLSPVFSPVLRSIFGTLKLAWRYAKTIFAEVVPEETRNRLAQNASKFIPMQEWNSEGGVLHKIVGRAKEFFQTTFNG